MEKLDQLIKEYEDLIEPQFDFNYDHSEEGNYDDSFNYGFESSEQYLYRDFLEELKQLKETLQKN